MSKKPGAPPNDGQPTLLSFFAKQKGPKPRKRPVEEEAETSAQRQPTGNSDAPSSSKKSKSTDTTGLQRSGKSAAAANHQRPPSGAAAAAQKRPPPGNDELHQATSKRGVDHDGSAPKAPRCNDADAKPAAVGKVEDLAADGGGREAAADADADDDAKIWAYVAKLRREGRAMGKGLSFRKLYGRERNAAQQAVHDAYLADVKELVAWAMEQGIVLNPASIIWALINKDDDMFTMNNRNSHIYVKEEDDGTIKIGVAVNGGRRVWYYIGKAEKKGLPEPKLISCIDVDNIPEPVQRELVQRVLAIAAKYMCEDFPEDLRKAFAYDMKGLPIGTQTFFRSIVKTIDQCIAVGGGKAVWGFLRRAVINMLEDGLQVWLLDRGFPINDDYSLHESVDSAVLSRYVYKDYSIRKDVRKCFEVLLSKKAERKRAEEESVSVEGVFSFKPARIRTTPSNHQYATEVVADVVFSDWFDPFADRTTIAESINAAYDPRQFPPVERTGARGKTINVVEDVELYGGGKGIETNAMAWKDTKSGSVLEYLCSDRETLLGHAAGSGWYVAWEARGITVLALDWDEDDLLRVIVVFIPWGNMIFVKGKEEVGWPELNRNEASTDSAHWASYFFELLEEPNSTLVPDNSLDRPTKNNIMFNWCIGYLHQYQFIKLPLRSANLNFKQFMRGSELNVFTTDCSDMIRIRDVNLVGECAQRLLARLFPELADPEDDVGEPEQPAHVRRDNKFVRYLLSKAYNCSSLDEVAHLMVDSLEDDRHEHGQEQVRTLASSRHDVIMRKTSAIHPELLRRFHQIYLDSRQNRGNRDTHNYALPADIRDVNKMVQWIVERGEETGQPLRVFIQGDGIGKRGKTTCGKYDGKKGAPFVEPADGTVIPPQYPSGEPVVFRSGLMIRGISFAGLKERFDKSMNGPGTTNRAKATRLKDTHRLEFNTDIFRYSHGAVSWMNEYRVAEVWFERK